MRRFYLQVNRSANSKSFKKTTDVGRLVSKGCFFFENLEGIFHAIVGKNKHHKS